MGHSEGGVGFGVGRFSLWLASHPIINQYTLHKQVHVKLSFVLIRINSLNLLDIHFVC